MKLWLLRFIPYSGGSNIDAAFRSERTAREAFLVVSSSNLLQITDDYGIAIIYDPRQGAIILTDTESSAQMARDLTEANHDAARHAGLVPKPKFDPGSTVQ